MKIEVNIEKKYFFGLMVIGLVILGIVGVVAYNSAAVGGNPAVFGHSVDEIDWTKIIQGNLSVNGTINAARFCIGTNCITSWPMGGGVGGNLNIIAGSGILITQSNGNVTISATGGGGTGGGSQWTTGTNGINYSGNVGIGAAAQSDNKLYVDGNFKVVGDYANSGEDNYSAWVVDNQDDTCDGNLTAEYACSLNESGPCADTRTINGIANTRIVTCVSSKAGLGVYGGNVEIAGRISTRGISNKIPFTYYILVEEPFGSTRNTKYCALYNGGHYGNDKAVGTISYGGTTRITQIVRTGFSDSPNEIEVAISDGLIQYGSNPVHCYADGSDTCVAHNDRCDSFTAKIWRKKTAYLLTE